MATNLKKTIYNHNRMMERFGDDLELITILLNDFKVTSGELLEKIKNAAIVGGMHELKDLIHGLKGIAANISAEKLRYFCSDLEEKIDEQKAVTYDNLKDDLNMLKKEIELFITETAQFLK